MDSSPTAHQRVRSFSLGAAILNRAVTRTRRRFESIPKKKITSARLLEPIPVQHGVYLSSSMARWLSFSNRPALYRPDLETVYLPPMTFLLCGPVQRASYQ